MRLEPEKMRKYMEVIVIANVFMGLLMVFISALRSQLVKKSDVVYLLNGTVSIQWVWVLSLLGLFAFVMRRHINDQKNNREV